MFKEIMAVIAVIAFSAGMTYLVSYTPSPTEVAVTRAQQEFESHITGCYVDHDVQECAAKNEASKKMHSAILADIKARPEAYKPY